MSSRDGYKIFSSYVEDKNVLSVLDSLANAYHSQNQRPLLEEELLIDLESDFSSLLSEVLQSSISKDIKPILISKLEDILSSIRSYFVNGTEGIEKAAQSLLIDLEIKKRDFSSEDKQNLIIKKIKRNVLVLVLFLKPSFWDIAGLIPDINSYWMPTFNEMVEYRQKIDQCVKVESDIGSICQEISQSLEKKRLEGSSPKSLPPSKED